jgi:hypothetical protein
MELKLNSHKFDEHQAIFIGEIIEQIKRKLEVVGFECERLKEITGNIDFIFACTIDNTSGIVFDGIDVNPYLTFQSGDNKIIHCGGNSFTHEYVFRNIG